MLSSMSYITMKTMTVASQAGLREINLNNKLLK